LTWVHFPSQEMGVGLEGAVFTATYPGGLA